LLVKPFGSYGTFLHWAALGLMLASVAIRAIIVIWYFARSAVMPMLFGLVGAGALVYGFFAYSGPIKLGCLVGLFAVIYLMLSKIEKHEPGAKGFD